MALGQRENDMDIKIHEFLVYDEKSGEIHNRINAYCKAEDTLPDLSKRWILKHVDGKLDNNLYFSWDTNICRADCFLDPTADLFFKLKEGTEEEFEFFMKNGYHMTSNDKGD